MGQIEYCPPFLQAHRCPSGPCGTGFREIQLGCSGDEWHCRSKYKVLLLKVRNTAPPSLSC